MYRCDGYLCALFHFACLDGNWFRTEYFRDDCPEKRRACMAKVFCFSFCVAVRLYILLNSFTALKHSHTCRSLPSLLAPLSKSLCWVTIVLIAMIERRSVYLAAGVVVQQLHDYSFFICQVRARTTNLPCSAAIWKELSNEPYRFCLYQWQYIDWTFPVLFACVGAERLEKRKTWQTRLRSNARMSVRHLPGSSPNVAWTSQKETLARTRLASSRVGLKTIP